MSAPSANPPQGGNLADADASAQGTTAQNSPQPVLNGSNASPQAAGNQAGGGVASILVAAIPAPGAAGAPPAAPPAPAAGALPLSAQELALLRSLLSERLANNASLAGPAAAPPVAPQALASAGAPPAVPNPASSNPGQGVHRGIPSSDDESEEDAAPLVSEILHTANLTDFSQVSAIFSQAAGRAALSSYTIPDSVKWSHIKPSGLRLENKVTKLPELIVSAANVYAKLLAMETVGADLSPQSRNIAMLLAELIAITREACRSQLAVMKIAAEAPAAEAVLREAYGRVFDMVNPASPKAVYEEIQLKQQALQIALTKQRLEKGGKKSGGQSSHHRHHHSHQAHGGPGGRGGSRGGRSNNPHGSGSGASTSQAPAGQL